MDKICLKEEKQVNSLEQFDIDLKGMTTDKVSMSYNLTDDFFKLVESEEPAKGNLVADVTVRKTMQAFEVTVKCNGYVIVECDRCLDDMRLEIETDDTFIAKFGDDDNYDDDIIIVSESKGILNIAWLMCEFISLAIPIQHIHEDGECNEEMALKLKEHTAIETEDGEDGDMEKPIDPRWEELKKILDNN